MINLIFILNVWFLNSSKSMGGKKRMTGCIVRNVVSGTTKCALVRKARCSLFVVDTTNHNYKEFSNFF